MAPATTSNPGCPIINYTALDETIFHYSIEISSSWETYVDINGDTWIKFSDTSGQTILDANGNQYKYRVTAVAKGGASYTVN